MDPITILKAAQMGMAALDVAQGFLHKAQVAGQMVAKAQAEGRDELLPQEVEELQRLDDVARRSQVDAINNAKD